MEYKRWVLDLLIILWMGIVLWDNLKKKKP
jgi:hypothetical protein